MKTPFWVKANYTAVVHVLPPLYVLPCGYCCYLVVAVRYAKLLEPVLLPFVRGPLEVVRLLAPEGVQPWSNLVG